MIARRRCRKQRERIEVLKFMPPHQRNRFQLRAAGACLAGRRSGSRLSLVRKTLASASMRRRAPSYPQAGRFQGACDTFASVLEFIAPTITGVKASDDSLIEAHQAIKGEPSVLYDAVALLVAEQGANQLTDEPAARDFVADAYAHSKFIAYTESAKPFLTKVVAADKLDNGFVEIKGVKDIPTFIEHCRKLRFWERHASVEAATRIRH